jgi:8-oxo-dGTP pyrophosphatase MutT (NUDIX family)
MARKTEETVQEIIQQLSNRRQGIMSQDEYFLSAVLLPLIEKQGQTHVLFEVRAEDLDVQPGEICFPGGGIEDHERDNPLNTALRETSEELGIKEEDVQVLGALDILPTPMGRLVYPYAGRILTPEIRPNPQEVAEIFTVPVTFLLNNPPTKTCVGVATQYSPDFPFDKIPPTYEQGWQKRWRFSIYYFEYEKYFIWGMTAKILYHFLKLCWPANNNYK